MNHRIINDVGYVKIYPMSSSEDDTFCHYCGRAADAITRLEWDHVPALNVKIPEGCESIRKTLVRSCQKCNLQASDVPHMDYQERHFWLKAAYLRKYKWLLINDDKYVSKKGIEGFLLAYINNSEVEYEAILNGLGFGIRSIDEIDSPILKLRTKSKRLLSSVITQYLSYPLIEDDEEDEPEEGILINEINEDNDFLSTYSEFINFLVAEKESNNSIDTDCDYQQWISEHLSRFQLLDLPDNPSVLYGKKWGEIVNERDCNLSEPAFASADLCLIHHANNILSSALSFNPTVYALLEDVIEFSKIHPNISNVDTLKSWLHEADDKFKIALLTVEKYEDKLEYELDEDDEHEILYEYGVESLYPLIE